MTTWVGVPATTAHNLNNLNNSREGVIQLSLTEETTKIHVWSPWLQTWSLFPGGGGDPEPDPPSLQGATVGPSSGVKHARTRGSEAVGHRFTHSRAVYVQVAAAADTNSTKNEHVVQV